MYKVQTVLDVLSLNALIAKDIHSYLIWWTENLIPWDVAVLFHFCFECCRLILSWFVSTYVNMYPLVVIFLNAQNLAWCAFLHLIYVLFVHFIFYVVNATICCAFWIVMYLCEKKTNNTIGNKYDVL